MNLSLILILLVFIVTGCRHPTCDLTPIPGSRLSQTPKLTEAEAIAIAKDAAEQHGRILEDYLPPKIRLDPETREWVLRFLHKRQGFTGFHIHVNYQTHDVQYLPRE